MQTRPFSLVSNFSRKFGCRFVTSCWRWLQVETNPLAVYSFLCEFPFSFAFRLSLSVCVFFAAIASIYRLECDSTSFSESFAYIRSLFLSNAVWQCRSLSVCMCGISRTRNILAMGYQMAAKRNVLHMDTWITLRECATTA